MTIFNEFLDFWLRPGDHYIPVSPDLGDLTAQLIWARDHDEAARLIAQAGHNKVMQDITNEQMECYMHLVLLELHSLHNR